MMRIEKNKPRKCARRDWSDLAPDLLGLIGSKLVSLFDVLSLKEVCSSWSIAAQRRNKKPSSLLLFFADSNEDHENPNKEDFLYLSVNQKKPYEVVKMPCSVPHDIHNHKMIGSNGEGWLITLDTNKHPYVTKLYSILRIQLPTRMICGRHLTECDHKSIKIIRAKLCADNPSHLVVIMIYIQYRYIRVGIWRSGDRHWTCLKDKNYIDIAFCGNKPYALRSNNKRSVYVESLDFGISSCTPGKRLSIAVPDLKYSNCRWTENWDHNHRLVPLSANEILIVKLEVPKFSIWKVDLREERCVRVDSLNGNTLILGEVTSAFVLSNNVEDYGYNRNSVYLVEGCNFNVTILRSYNLENGKCEQLWKSNISLKWSTSRTGTSNIAPHLFGLIHLYC